MKFDQQLVFVTGKGGVGKSLISAMLAHNLSALEGKKVLLIESESGGSLAKYFEHANVGYEPIEVFSNIFLCQINTQDALSEYLRLYAKIPSWAKFGPLSKLIDIVAHGAPGVKEILIVGKICYELKNIIENKSDYDCIIVDSPATGHVISLLEAPWSMKNFVSSGLVNNQTKWMCDLLEDNKKTQVLVVTTSDEVVLAETNDLVQKINIETHSSLLGIVVNKNSNSHLVAAMGSLADMMPEIVKQQFVFMESERAKDKKILSELKVKNIYSFPLINDHTNSLRNIIKNSCNLELAQDY
jgi:anion-transporting  ArsA/GET3 family ATPase